ncbi:MAG: Tab2/Atab2 family RNA-binding protein [Thermosynechococcus sp. Uc]|uniref:Tab2/Atab2 family RNA-binding protein n=1 Tax=Thermosynechococcus sp. Uc TaxID=3034853 RepID=UPI001A0924D3|nr:Tab2/Atab2 family RNA-binding protein [Thermosynechococcus sp. Uc]MDM7327074.1 Tab2/Atab2 family RNA-binding protein [Thermosynechococcus sp. Uc]HIK26382.1 Tab2/Atab2 family RNA-binding protein [Thermosynechococcus sp. M46_R2017_013]
MSCWQVDFYRRPLHTPSGLNLWELVICSPEDDFYYTTFCPEPLVSSTWLITEFKNCSQPLPERIQVFRPQSLGLVELACQELNIPLEATRRTPALKHYLRRRAQEYPSLKTYTYTGEAYDPLAIEQPPPLPLPEDIWGESWQFAAITPADLEQLMQYPLRILAFDMAMLPEALGLTSDVLIPGIILYGGRKSLKLARWFQEQVPYRLEFVPGQPCGVVLHSGLRDRWVFLTFENAEIAKAGELFRDRLQSTQGLHFLLIQPTPSDVTYTALWLLQPLE